MYWTHARVSYLKSAARIGASIGTVIVALAFPGPAGVVALAVGYGVAELIGVWEEVGARGE